LSQSLAVAPAAYRLNWGEIIPSVRAAEARVDIIDPVTSPDWNREVLSHPESTIFHLSQWARVLISTYGHNPVYLRFSYDDNLAALLPMMEVKSPITGNRGVSLPFSDFCPPLIFDQRIGVFPLLEAVNQIGRKRHWRYFEIRSNALVDSFSTPSEEYYGHELDLTRGAGRLLAAVSPSVRRAIRKAEKSELTIEISQTWASMLDFYRLHLRTRRRHGLPPQSLSFFHNIDREIIKTGYGFIVVAKAALRPVAAAVFFHSGREALYKFGASDARAQSLRPNNLVMWKAIEHLAASGFHKLRFGRTDLTDEGLRRFKRSWGGLERQIRYYRYEGMTRPSGDRVPGLAHGFYTRIFRRLPLFVNRTIGKLVYPHLD
jgi:CelD/BcsL family acetyltransferase involved in cellulose biosynthesis